LGRGARPAWAFGVLIEAAPAHEQTVNGQAFCMAATKPVYNIKQGRRYRIKFRDASDDVHPVHLPARF
jgi:hypothetical protein